MPLTAEARTLAETLVDGARKTVMNADELFDDARLLADAGHVARAFLLHQISLEECRKRTTGSNGDLWSGQRLMLKPLAAEFTAKSVRLKAMSIGCRWLDLGPLVTGVTAARPVSLFSGRLCLMTLSSRFQPPPTLAAKT